MEKRSADPRDFGYWEKRSETAWQLYGNMTPEELLEAGAFLTIYPSYRVTLELPENRRGVSAQNHNAKVQTLSLILFRASNRIQEAAQERGFDSSKIRKAVSICRERLEKMLREYRKAGSSAKWARLKKLLSRTLDVPGLGGTDEFFSSEEKKAVGEGRAVLTRLSSKLAGEVGRQDGETGTGASGAPPEVIPVGEWNDCERKILRALFYTAKTTDELSSELPFSHSRLRDALLTKGILRTSGIVKNRRGDGYYRTDAPPERGDPDVI